MKERYLPGAVIVLATALLVACGGSTEGGQQGAGSNGTPATEAGSEADAGAPSPEVRVVVRDRFGEPVAGATVTVTAVGGDEEGAVIEATTDGSGVATLETGARRLTVSAARSGYTVATVQEVFVSGDEPAAELELLPVPDGDGVWLVGAAGLIPLPIADLSADARWPMNYTIEPEQFDLTLPPARHVFLTKGYDFTRMQDVSFLPDVTFGQGGVTLSGIAEQFEVTGGGTITTYAFDIRPGRWVLADFERHPEFQDATIAAENVAVLILAAEGAVAPTGAGQRARVVGDSAVGPLAGSYSADGVTLTLRDGGPAVIEIAGERLELIAVYATDAGGNEVLTLTNARGEQELVRVDRRDGRVVLVDDWGNVMEGRSQQ